MLAKWKSRAVGEMQKRATKIRGKVGHQGFLDTLHVVYLVLVELDGTYGSYRKTFGPPTIKMDNG